MFWLKKNWYLLLLAFVLSLGTNLGLVYLKRDSWAPEWRAVAVPNAEPVQENSFVAWDFAMAEAELMMEQLLEKEKSLADREAELLRLEERLKSERVELDRLRERVEAQREEMNASMVAFETAETGNIRKLSKIYSEMDAPSAVAILRETETPLVVKILSGMDQKSAAKILEAMSKGPQGSELDRAARITEQLRVVLPE